MNWRQEMLACQDCELWHDRTQVVPLSGTGRVAFVGEAPGATEDMLGIPFVGKAGQLLNEALVAAGMNRSDVATFNTVGCRPRDNLFAHAWDADAPNKCAKHFDQQLAESGAWLIVLCGMQPTKIVCDRQGRSIPQITKTRNRPWWHDHRLWYPVYHPSFVLRSGGLNSERGREFVSDLTRVANLHHGVEYPPRPPQNWGPVVPLSDSAPKEFPVLIYSSVLDEVVWVAQSSTEAPPGEYPVWSLAELARIKANPDFSLDDLRMVASIKRLMNVEVVR